MSPRDVPPPGWGGQRRQGQTTFGQSPERPLFLGALPVSSALLAPPWYPLPSAPVLCLRPLSGAEQPGPCLGGPAPGFPVWLAGLPLPSLPALGSGAFSACSSRPHSCWKRRQGGRARRGRIRESRFGACCNSGKTHPPLFNYSSAPRSRAPSPAFGPFLSLYVGGGYFTALVCPASEVAFPLPALRFLLASACCLLSPSSASPFLAVAVEGVAGPRSAGTIALHQPGQAQGSAWLRRGLIITCHRPSASLGLCHPGGGRRGHMARWAPWLGPNQPPRPFQRHVPSLVPQHLSHPFLFLLSPFFHSSPWPGLSPPAYLCSGFWQVDCRSWEEQLSLFGTELDGISLPKSPPAGHFLPTILAQKGRAGGHT